MVYFIISVMLCTYVYYFSTLIVCLFYLDQETPQTFLIKALETLLYENFYFL